MRTKLYLDTSVPSAFFDTSKPMRQLITQKWFENEAANYELSEPEDAYHIAIATVNGIDTLASWNFKHIVSINPIRKIHEINLKRGCQIVEIGSLEIFGGSIYGNL